MFGGIANLSLHVTGKSSTMTGGCPRLDGELVRALTFFKSRISRGPPRARQPAKQKPLLAWTLYTQPVSKLPSTGHPVDTMTLPAPSINPPNLQDVPSDASKCCPIWGLFLSLLHDQSLDSRRYPAQT